MSSLDRVPQARGLPLFWQTVWARAYPRMVGAFREPSWMFFETLLPLMSVAAYVFVYRAIDAPPDYIGFVVVGGAMTAFCSGSTSCGAWPASSTGTKTWVTSSCTWSAPAR